MDLEAILARALNRKRRPSARPSGFHVGPAESLIGQNHTACALSVTPTQHTFISGRTGSGKTTLLLRLMAEHTRLGVPFAFIDFHGHATEDLLVAIGRDSTAPNCVLLEPSMDPVVGWNPLDCRGGDAHACVQELLAVFRHRLWPDAWGPRLEELLRMALLACAEARLTLLEAQSFVSRPEFRREVLRRVKLPDVREFWTVRFERLSPSQRTLVSETVLNKLSVFHDPSIRYVVGQERDTLNLDAALDEGRSIVANLSGRLRGNSFLLAALLVAHFKSAVYRRPPTARPYAIFLDEFQEMVAVEALDDYLRSFRKFGVSVYLATQQLELPRELKAAIFGNCSRFLSFATSASDAAFLAKEFGGSDGAIAGELLPDLKRGEAIYKLRGKPAQLVRVLAPPATRDEGACRSARAACLRLGLSRAEIDRQCDKRRNQSVHAYREDPPLAPRNGTLPEGYGGY